MAATPIKIYHFVDVIETSDVQATPIGADWHIEQLPSLLPINSGKADNFGLDFPSWQQSFFTAGAPVQPVNLFPAEPSAQAINALPAEPPAQQITSKHVVFFGIDGAQWSRVQELQKAGRLPSFDTLLKGNQLHAQEAYTGGDPTKPLTQQPTYSGPGWASLLTGTWANEHGVENNIGGQVEDAASSIFERVDYAKPDSTICVNSHWENIPGTFFAEEAEQGIIDVVNSQLSDKANVNLTLSQIKEGKATFIFQHYEGPDAAGHEFGTNSPGGEYDKALIKAFVNLVKILEAINKRMAEHPEEDWMLISATDHGRNADDGMSHGGQSASERQSFVISNKPLLQSAAPVAVTAVVPTILDFMDITYKKDRLPYTSLLDDNDANDGSGQKPVDLPVSDSGTSGNDILLGGIGKDILHGLGGDDTIRGGAGADKLYGGDGNDTISGGAGRDLLFGEAGDDVLEGDSGDDVLNGGAGNDRLVGGADDDTLLGGDGNDTLIGGSGRDMLYGGSGADWMEGGSGGDTYEVDNVGDTVVELGTNPDAIAGIAAKATNAAFIKNREKMINLGDNDTVVASIDYSLKDNDNIENLTLSGSANLRGTGNKADNILTGNDGNNLLDGKAGNDLISGGGGRDTLLGGDGDDWLDGGRGHDVLTGGEGRDVFAFGVNLQTQANGKVSIQSIGESSDNVRDFAHGVDKIALSASDFLSFGPRTDGSSLQAANFVNGTAAKDKNDYIIYDSSTGDLWYDADGSGSQSKVLVAHFDNKPAIDVSDFMFIA